MQAVTVGNTLINLPRLPLRKTHCAAAQLVTLDGETRPALVWATMRGLKWQTVKMRRLRGDNWTEALEPELRKTIMDGLTLRRVSATAARKSA